MAKVLTGLTMAGALAALMVPGAGMAKTAPKAAAKDKVLASAALMKGDTMPAGLASIVEAKGKLGLKLSLSGLPAGVHAVHLHMRGVCEVPAFTSAGGHLNPAGHQHGRDNPMGAHMGDMPNITVGDDGTANVTLPLDYKADELLTALFDKDGGAVVVHAAPDDYKTDPTGNAGGRIACGAFVRGQ